MLPFRRRLTFEQRRTEFERIHAHRATRIPVIMERNGIDTPRIDKEKFLVPFDLTVSQLMFVARRRLKMDSSKALFLLINGTLPPSSTTMSSLYDKHASEDGFMYVVYTTENTFG